MPGDRLISIEVGLAYPDQQGLDSFLTSVETPGSPLYHHYLTSQEFIQRFAPTTQDVQSVESYFAGQGAQHMIASSDRMTLNFQIPASDVPAAFGTSLAWYRDSQGATFYSAESTPHLQSSVASLVSGVDGLTNRFNPGIRQYLTELATFHVPLHSAGATHGPQQYDSITTGGEVFWGTDFQGVYDELPLLDAGMNGSGYSIATILWSGFNETYSQDLAPWDPTAIAKYFSDTFPSGTIGLVPNAEPVTYNYTTPPLPASDIALGDDGGGIVENSLDLEMAASVAPGASIYCFYFAGSTLAYTNMAGLPGAFDQALSSALSFVYPGKGLAVISNSWGLPDINDTIWNGLAEMAAGEGVTIVASSGDQGDAPVALTDRPQGQWPGWPATEAFQTYGVTAVGGTTIDVTGAPTGDWNPNGDTLPTPGYDATSIVGLDSQTPWYIDSQGTVAGSEGGISAIYNEPLWQAQSAAQSGIIYSAPKENVNYARGVPDVASVGDDTVVYDGSDASGVYGTILAGTSIASPVFAGFLTVIAENNGHKLGFIDPALYSIGGYFLKELPGASSDPFHGLDDVTSGSNYVFNASAGWDPITGWGTPDVSLLAAALASNVETEYVYNPNGVPGQAGTLPTQNNSGAPNFLLILILVIAAVVVVAVVVAIAVHVHRRKQQAYRPAHPGYAPAYGQPPPGYYGYGQPPPPPQYAPQYGQPQYAPQYAPQYPQYQGYPPQQGYSPGYAQPPAPSAPTVTCRYCQGPRPLTPTPCPYCGAQL
jgi:subtilase family serine protease